jgi:hypothetical protein
MLFLEPQSLGARLDRLEFSGRYGRGTELDRELERGTDSRQHKRRRILQTATFLRHGAFQARTRDKFMCEITYGIHRIIQNNYFKLLQSIDSGHQAIQIISILGSLNVSPSTR